MFLHRRLILLFCLDRSKGLKSIWHSDDNTFAGYACLIGSPNRVLVVGLNGELVLLDAQSDKPNILGRAQVFENDHGVYSHPALVGARLFLRGSSEIVCINLRS